MGMADDIRNRQSAAADSAKAKEEAGQRDLERLSANLDLVVPEAVQAFKDLKIKPNVKRNVFVRGWGDLRVSMKARGEDYGFDPCRIYVWPDETWTWATGEKVMRLISQGPIYVSTVDELRSGFEGAIERIALGGIRTPTPRR